MVLSRFLAVTGLVLLVSSCTVANPLYGPAGDAGIAVHLDASVDLALVGIGDLAVRPGADLAQPMTCTAGDRACAQMNSLVCQGGVLQPDRVCPSNAGCAGGYCQAPPLANNGVGKNCDLTGDASESLCITGGGGNTPTCTPFIDPASMGQGLVWRCAKPVGSGVPGTACSTGKQCRSGFCGSNGTCFRACASIADCPMNGGGTFKCDVVEIVVEGLVAQAMSCIPM